jgi:hypothetical protein
LNTGDDWLKQLPISPVAALLSSHNKALEYFVERDLLNKAVAPIDEVWHLPEPQRLLKKQQPDGFWSVSGRKPEIYPPGHYKLVETFKNFRILVERYEFDRRYLPLQKAAEYLFSFQTPAGDFRGMLANQYATYYTGYFLSLLIKAGYQDDSRVIRGMEWLLSMRHNDGGWTIPLLTHKYNREEWYRLTSTYVEPLEPDRSQPFSHNWTNMVLQAFAVHPEYRHSVEAREAGLLLKSRFFQPDVYTSYQAAGYWARFAFWWPNLLTALDALYSLGFNKDDPDIQKGLDWFIRNQQKDGLWNISPQDKPSATKKYTEERLWLGLAISRLFKWYFG